MSQREEIREACRLAKSIRVKSGASCGDLAGPRYVRQDVAPAYVVREDDFEVRYMIACSQLGFTDPHVVGYVKRLNCQRQAEWEDGI